LLHGCGAVNWNAGLGPLAPLEALNAELELPADVVEVFVVRPRAGEAGP
jgi:hypothetical protein